MERPPELPAFMGLCLLTMDFFRPAKLRCFARPAISLRRSQFRYLSLQTNAVTIAMWISPNANQVTYTGLLMNRDSGGDAAGFGFGGTTSGGMPRAGLHLELEQRLDVGLQFGALSAARHLELCRPGGPIKCGHHLSVLH